MHGLLFATLTTMLYLLMPWGTDGAWGTRGLIAYALGFMLCRSMDVAAESGAIGESALRGMHAPERRSNNGRSYHD